VFSRRDQGPSAGDFDADQLAKPDRLRAADRGERENLFRA
jgi:hypothetical protein